ncbi:sugar phosphate isomerase [Arthrobacter sp. MYb227]|uniref:sugar phosphate isomerase/epimerase family protein n=1 Tax=Arthrobacter sp. MYb227 TaxID=1848601 RepID=UPI000CFAFB3C|nr:sugar phosphate isomerase/epimerase family protein [Arthrobacter sp. MYb227]PQZ94715.1 sugar phosphate isomerase [Arthrobacter sp. MYb227]
MSDVKAGLSSFILASPFTDEHLSMLPEIKAMGYDLLEICVEDPTLLTGSLVREAALSAGLEISVGGAFGPDRDISHDTAEGRRAGFEYLAWLVHFAAEVGSPRVSGPMYSAVGKTRMLTDEERTVQRGWAAEGLREVADLAAEYGIVLALEPLNRFETDLVNTVAQALELCDLIGRENVGICLDTFHMNIEEKDIAAAIMAASGRIVNFQVSENDRGTPGTGHIPWKDTARALQASGYRGPVIVETFLPGVVEIARAVSLWRPVAPSMEGLMVDSLSFIRREFVLS